MESWPRFNQGHGPPKICVLVFSGVLLSEPWLKTKNEKNQKEEQILPKKNEKMEGRGGREVGLGWGSGSNLLFSPRTSFGFGFASPLSPLPPLRVCVCFFLLREEGRRGGVTPHQTQTHRRHPPHSVPSRPDADPHIRRNGHNKKHRLTLFFTTHSGLHWEKEL